MAGGGACCLRVCGLKKEFMAGDRIVQALRCVELQIEAGEFVAIMGPSGCGKSTLLHLVSGLDKADAGVVEIEGRDISGLNDRELTLLRRRRIGLIFQAFNLVGNLTAEENALLPLLLDGGSADAGRGAALFGRLGLNNCAGRWPETLSGGEQQRVAIARALINNPALILADEPTGSLDFANGQALCSLLHDLCTNDGRTILMVTHEPAVAAWADRVLVMKDGLLLGQLAHSARGDSNRLAAAYHDLLAQNSPAPAAEPVVAGGE